MNTEGFSVTYQIRKVNHSHLWWGPPLCKSTSINAFAIYTSHNLNLINKPRLLGLPGFSFFFFSIFPKRFWTFSLGAAELLLNCTHVRFLALKGYPDVILGFSPPLGKTLISLFGAFWLPGQEQHSVCRRIKFLSVQIDERKHFDLQTQSAAYCSLFLLLLLPEFSVDLFGSFDLPIVSLQPKHDIWTWK